jgi:hypothetical protein
VLEKAQIAVDANAEYNKAFSEIVRSGALIHNLSIRDPFPGVTALSLAAEVPHRILVLTRKLWQISKMQTSGSSAYMHSLLG